VRGTCHKPQSPPSGDKCRIGVLFVSWMWPRAGNGDSVVYWAEALAKCGYFTFRFNFPGMGDADGDFSIPGLDITGGAYRSALSSITDQLVERFRLRALVVVGHCDMAVNAIYAAAAGQNIDGLILLDPYFHLPQPSKKGLLLRLNKEIVKALAWDRIAQPKLRAVALALLAVTRRMYRRFSPKRLVISRKTLPANANLALLRCWKQLAANRIPMLILRSPNSTPKPGEFDYLAFLRRDSTASERVTVIHVERAGAVACTHAFMERAGKEIVRTNTERWLRTYFASNGYGDTLMLDTAPIKLARAL
jgi:pimeloyl-ACP methyl ester carboxylesterase